MKPYKVLVVDDSAFMRKIISDLIEKDSEFQVMATAVNGREAVEKVKELHPDLVTMDVEMPEMNGLEALRLIMLQHPLPVIMLSGINEEGMKETILALEGGAFDFIRKPSIASSNDINSVGEALREQMKEAMLARERREARSVSNLLVPEAPSSTLGPPAPAPEAPEIRPETKRYEIRKDNSAGDKGSRSRPHNPALSQPAGSDTKKPAELRRPDKQTETSGASAQNPAGQVKPQLKAPKNPGGSSSDIPVLSRRTKPPVPEIPPAASGGSGKERQTGVKDMAKLVAVGCSTGGPRALKAFLENIPADFPAPIVIVQHMPPNFTKSLAQRLNTFSPLEVMEAEHGMILRKGAAYIAPGGYHMKVAESTGGQYVISLSKEEARNGHRPSVDTLFESLLPLTSLERHAVIMTGMGSDGAKMMKSLYDSGVTSTFAESEETCVVYGMPRSAVELKCVSYILPLQDIAPRLVQVVK